MITTIHIPKHMPRKEKLYLKPIQKTTPLMGCTWSPRRMCLEKHHCEPAEHPPLTKAGTITTSELIHHRQVMKLQGAGSVDRIIVEANNPAYPPNQTGWRRGWSTVQVLHQVSLNPWGEGTKSTFHQESQQPSGTVRSPGSKACSTCPSPLQAQSAEPEDAVFHWWPSRGRWQGRGACPPGAGVVGQLPGWEAQVGYGRVCTVVLWASQQRSHHPHRVPKGMHYPRRSRTARWLASTGPRAERNENTCGVRLHIRLWRHVRTTGWATGRLAPPPRRWPAASTPRARLPDSEPAKGWRHL